MRRYRKNCRRCWFLGQTESSAANHLSLITRSDRRKPRVAAVSQPHCEVLTNHSHSNLQIAPQKTCVHPEDRNSGILVDSQRQSGLKSRPCHARLNSENNKKHRSVRELATFPNVSRLKSRLLVAVIVPQFSCSTITQPSFYTHHWLVPNQGP